MEADAHTVFGDKHHVVSVVALAGAAAVATLLSAGASQAQSDARVLRIVPHSNLAILDPIWTTAYMSRNHGYMIYDTLFGTDADGKVKPQMVQSWDESPDHRLWTFKLRSGLAFHDGAPVTGEDVTASLARWGKRDAMGIALFSFVDRMDSPAPDTFRIFLREEEKRAAEHPGLDRICKAAVEYDLPLNFLFWGRVDDGIKIIDRHPNTRFIVDHLGLLQPRVPPAPAEPWADLPKIVELAKRPNAVIKVSGACTLSKQPYPFPDIWDPLQRVFDAWGFERCLWGTDWTRAFAVVNYEQAVKPFLETKRLSDSERAMLMGGACAKAYRWSPKKG